jgi:hypothetical protein
MPYQSPGTNIEDTTYDICTSRRTYGVELEFASANDCRQRNENRPEYGRFGSKPDGSIRCSNYYGVEFYSPIFRGDAGFQSIDNLCEDAHDTDPNDSCGFHLHIGIADMTDSQRLNLMRAAALVENVARMLVMPERSDNHYCGSWVAYDPDIVGPSFEECITDDRYSAFNFYAWMNHKTLEIRLHHATKDATEVKNWAKLWLAFVDYIAANGSLVAFRGSDETVFDNVMLLAGQDVADYYTRRAIDCGYAECLRKELVSA